MLPKVRDLEPLVDEELHIMRLLESLLGVDNLAAATTTAQLSSIRQLHLHARSKVRRPRGRAPPEGMAILVREEIAAVANQVTRLLERLEEDAAARAEFEETVRMKFERSDARQQKTLDIIAENVIELTAAVNLRRPRKKQATLPQPLRRVLRQKN